MAAVTGKKTRSPPAFKLYESLNLKINLIEKPSNEGLVDLIKDNRSFNLIYVDGSHENLLPMIDSALSLSLLQNKGLIILDDHFWPDVKIIKKLFDNNLEKIYESWKIAAYKK